MQTFVDTIKMYCMRMQLRLTHFLLFPFYCEMLKWVNGLFEDSFVIVTFPYNNWDNFHKFLSNSFNIYFLTDILKLISQISDPSLKFV